MAAAIIATCSGVTRTSYWPIADCAVCGGLSWAGTVLGVTGMGTVRDRPKPNFAAWSCRALAPSLSPRPANAVLQEICRARVIETTPPGPQATEKSLCSLAVVCGRSSTAGPGIWLDSVYCPVDSAAAAVTSLKTEPGG